MTRTTFWLLVALCGCGRLGFEGAAPDAMCSNDCCSENSDGFAGGVGTQADPYRICSAEQFVAIGKSPALWGSHFRLTADIDLENFSRSGSSGSLSPIGTTLLPFTGSFDGQGHTISNLTLAVTTDGGMFGLTDGATIENLVLRNQTIVVAVPSTNIGLLIGSAINTTIHKVSVTGQIRGLDSATTYEVAGLVGRLSADNGTVRLFEVSVTISTSDGFDAIGGVAGVVRATNSGTVEIERVRADVQLGRCQQSGNTFGAFVALITIENASQLNLRDSIATGAIAFPRHGSFSGNFIGTLFVSGNDSSVELTRLASLANLEIAGDYPVSAGNAGGLVGALNAKDQSLISISRSYNSGNVVLTNANANTARIGGLLGIIDTDTADASIEVSDSYTTATITSSGPAIWLSPGVGALETTAGSNISFKTVYAAGAVSGAAISDAGGFVGNNSALLSTVTGADVFYDVTANSRMGVGFGTQYEFIFGLSSNQIRAATTFATWDSSIWNVVDGQLPTLKGLPVP